MLGGSHDPDARRSTSSAIGALAVRRACAVRPAPYHADASQFLVPGAAPSLAGLVLHHAYVTVDPSTFAISASNAVRALLVP
ncbi:hypothetical protein Pla163_24890 [Planctomycetes bacterium Pla163]|uniref:Uncharacterized protein n=1 Tax=Rohdeia mirabilis TaxID=2528008 RepID=A0A518D1K5_9BACT|nr:hypothetical protein Pla163_24890 [Planctomycetes bacterium Pla163]